MARAVMIIADISGYTRFMKVHRINLAHAQYIVAQLLEAVIDAAEPALELAKLEGDAAFFYAKLPDAPEGDEISTFGGVITAIRRGFLTRRMELTIDRLCTCDGCTQAGDLKLKFVAHLGEVAFQKVKRYKELAGVDVIFVHRLLKNRVPVSEYVLMSEPVYEKAGDELRRFGTEMSESLEGLGDVRTYFVDLAKVASELPKPLEPSLLRRVWKWLRMTWRSIPYFVGTRKACDGFRNMGAVDPSLSLPPPSGTLESLPPPSRVD